MKEFQGNLYVFVDTLAAGDDAVPREAQGIFSGGEPGDLAWYMAGRAVGKNGRGHYCARGSTSRLRSFSTFAEAMNYVRDRRKARPGESFHLVYELDGRKSVVTSLEQIQRSDGDWMEFEQGTTAELAQHGEFDLLAQRVGKIVASNALMLLRTWNKDGEAAARTRFSNATYERLWCVLREARLIEEGESL